MASTLEHFFEPRGVAIIGASSSPDKLSYGILKNMLSYGYQGSVYPVNPKAEEILNLKCYPEISKVPDPVDLAVVILPASFIPEVLTGCGKRGIRAVTIISGGFKEIGDSGKILEENIKKIAKSYQMRLIGPNCVGTMNLITGLNTTFIKGKPATGGIGFISQSGAICGGVVDHVVDEGIGFSHFLSLGNEADVDETDMIEYLGNDPDTRVIAAYIEGIQDGRKFLQITKQITKKKPVVVLKAGRSDEGAKAVSSHTGSLAGSHAAFQAAFRQSGAIEVFSTTDLLNVSMALDWLKLPKCNRVAIVTNSGGPAALASDSLAAQGLCLASIDTPIQEKLKEKLNPAAQTANPVDMLGGADEKEYSHALKYVLQDEGVDMVLVILVPQALVNPVKVAEAVVNSARTTEKPVITCLMGSDSIQDARKVLQENRAPIVDFPELTGVMLGSLYMRSRGQDLDTQKNQRGFKVDKHIVDEIFRKHPEKKHWGEYETRWVLEAYGISMVEGRLVKTLEEAKSAAEVFGYPLVLKVASEGILHKSEAGGVAVGIIDADELIKTFNQLMKNAIAFNKQAVIDGMLIEKMAAKGEEVIVGVKRDPGFGPLVMFGMGGVFVELFKDVSFRVAPLSMDDAMEMVRETKAFQLLNSWREGPRYDIESICDTILRLSQLALDFPNIQEIEINPLRVFPEGKGAMALDCRMILV
ncbi:MAG TPA: acetate--CoA ligase family protein [Pelolinea sp.]|nr:acetate--CoA ligase family protein [Pelolinea sp.]